MKKHRQEDKDGVQSYPWETKCLSAGEFSEWKVLCVGLSSDPRGHMSLDELGLDALFRIWATAGCGVARSASWFGGDSVGRGGGHSTGHGPRFFFKAPVELPPGWFDELEVQRYTATPSSMLAMTPISIMHHHLIIVMYHGHCHCGSHPSEKDQEGPSVPGYASVFLALPISISSHSICHSALVDGF